MWGLKNEVNKQRMGAPFGTQSCKYVPVCSVSYLATSGSLVYKVLPTQCLKYLTSKVNSKLERPEGPPA
jgi:hypothetical protein